jgi:hypothetical protein
MSTSTATKHRTSKPAAFVVCLENGEYEADLVVGKVYRTVKPERNDRPADLRVIDESGEDYLYPAKWFAPVELPPRAKRALAVPAAQHEVRI